MVLGKRAFDTGRMKLCVNNGENVPLSILKMRKSYSKDQNVMWDQSKSSHLMPDLHVK